MKIEPRLASQAEQPAPQEDTTTEFPAGTEPMAHRRTTVTVERETLSYLIRRPVGGAAEQPADGESAPETPNELSGGKP
jgi:hypothetical protein